MLTSCLICLANEYVTSVVAFTSYYVPSLTGSAVSKDRDIFVHVKKVTGKRLKYGDSIPGSGEHIFLPSVTHSDFYAMIPRYSFKNHGIANVITFPSWILYSSETQTGTSPSFLFYALIKGYTASPRAILNLRFQGSLLLMWNLTQGVVKSHISLTRHAGGEM
jgi:hypothetical protein